MKEGTVFLWPSQEFKFGESAGYAAADQARTSLKARSTATDSLVVQTLMGRVAVALLRQMESIADRSAVQRTDWCPP